MNSNVIIRLARSSKFDLCRELAVDAFRVTTESVTKLGGKKNSKDRVGAMKYEDSKVEQT